jgi:tRNA uridine 5-carboxymethylaminomethyl modification enzyme
MEPYRMFTSRAEYRLLLREDNADLRLTEKGRDLGLVNDHRWEMFCNKREAIGIEKERLAKTWIQPGTEAAEKLNLLIEQPITREYSLLDLLKRPGISYADIASLKGECASDPQVSGQVETQIKYSGYIDRQSEDIERLKRYENTRLPGDFDYLAVEGMSNEVKQKLSQAKPETLARAARIPGVTPAAISLLLIYLKKRGALDAKSQSAKKTA